MTPEQLLRIFETRKNRFKFLSSGIDIISPNKGEKWLEVGCNNGDATNYLTQQYSLNVRGLDINEYNVKTSKERYPSLSFDLGDATNTGYEKQTFDGIFSEAAFSPIPNKADLVKEYSRIIKPGGYVLINDFALKEKINKEERYEYSHIPCFAGVGFVSEYIQFFKDFKLIKSEENYSELLAIVLHLSKESGVKPIEIGSLLSRYYNIGHEKISCPFDESRGMMAKAKLTYARMIFQKI
ncbi:MAG: class I SAM-dependent methyltransferase [Pleomorphochaeta sp.]